MLRRFHGKNFHGMNFAKSWKTKCCERKKKRGGICALWSGCLSKMTVQKWLHKCFHSSVITECENEVRLRWNQAWILGGEITNICNNFICKNIHVNSIIVLCIDKVTDTMLLVVSAPVRHHCCVCAEMSTSVAWKQKSKPHKMTTWQTHTTNYTTDGTWVNTWYRSDLIKCSFLLFLCCYFADFPKHMIHL